jgi:hypothetical protein
VTVNREDNELVVTFGDGLTKSVTLSVARNIFVTTS